MLARGTRSAVAVALMAGALVLGAAACGDDEEQPTAQGGTGQASAAPTSLLEKGKLKICEADETYPPLSILDDPSNPKGFDPDAAKAVAKKWGVEPEFTLIKFDGLVPALVAKRCDLMWAGLYVSKERLQQADAVGYLKTGAGLIVAKGNSAGITDRASLAGKRVAVQSGGANIKILEALNKDFKDQGQDPIKVSGYPQVAETVAAVRNGKADATIETDVAVANIVTTSKGTLEEVPGVFEPDTDFGVYVRKGERLKQDLTDAMSTLYANGTLQQLAEQYGLDPKKLIDPAAAPS